MHQFSSELEQQGKSATAGALEQHGKSATAGALQVSTFATATSATGETAGASSATAAAKIAALERHVQQLELTVDEYASQADEQADAYEDEINSVQAAREEDAVVQVLRRILIFCLKYPFSILSFCCCLVLFGVVLFLVVFGCYCDILRVLSTGDPIRSAGTL
jgi:hypothetical protein